MRLYTFVYNAAEPYPLATCRSSTIGSATASWLNPKGNFYLGGLHGCTCASYPEGNLYGSLKRETYTGSQLNCIGTSPPSEQRSPTWHKSSSLEHSMLLTHGHAHQPARSTRECSPNFAIASPCISLATSTHKVSMMSKWTCWYHKAHPICTVDQQMMSSELSV